MRPVPAAAALLAALALAAPAAAGQSAPAPAPAATAAATPAAAPAITAIPAAEVTGVVSVRKNGDQVTGITLVSGRGAESVSYFVVLDASGRRLAAHDGKTLRVTGRLAGTTLTVTGFRN